MSTNWSDVKANQVKMEKQTTREETYLSKAAFIFPSSHLPIFFPLLDLFASITACSSTVLTGFFLFFDRGMTLKDKWYWFSLDLCVEVQ